MYYYIRRLDAQDIQKLTELLATKSDVRVMKEDLIELKLSVGSLVTAADAIVS